MKYTAFFTGGSTGDINVNRNNGQTLKKHFCVQYAINQLSLVAKKVRRNQLANLLQAATFCDFLRLF